MSAVTAQAVPAVGMSGLFSRIAWHWRNNPKIELWILWYLMVFFYNLFGILFVLLTHVMPPPKPYVDAVGAARWFDDHRSGLLIGFAIDFLVPGLAAGCNALIGYSMRRMSVSRAFAYSYIAIYSASAVPGMLVTAILLTVGAMRPDRDPQLIYWLYDAGFMCFEGTMGIFLIGTLVWLIAILIDKNRVFPKWFGYLNICNLITEIVIAPAWIFKQGAFSWNGTITFWIDTIVFAIYTIVFIVLLRRMIQRDDFGDGPMPS
jgi:hypothetical protein